MKKILSNYFKFSDNEYQLFISQANIRHYKKNEHILFADKAVDKLYFIKSGFVRGYRIIDGVDLTHHFFLENWFTTDYESYLTGKRGELYFETIIDTTVYEFKRSTLHSFFLSNPKFDKIRFIQAEDAYIQIVNRLKGFQTKDLKERYKNLFNRNPQLFNLVP